VLSFSDGQLSVLNPNPKPDQVGAQLSDGQLSVLNDYDAPLVGP
jgi:hypothetical protein